MDAKPLDDIVRNIDLRLERVEQFLPTLATKDELREAVADLATEAELQETARAIRAELREEGERTRRHFDIVAEEMKGQTRLIAEALDDHRDRTDRRFGDVDARLSTIDRRVTRLESKRR
jgi:ATP-dependent Lon protease